MKCRKEMIPKKNGVRVVHFLNNKKADGIDFVASGDIWKCDICKAEFICGFGDKILGCDLPDQKEFLEVYDEYIEIKR